MEFNELFYKEPYKKRFEECVVRCVPEGDGYRLTLDDTLFYPEGGGQPCDSGVIIFEGKEIKVSDVRREKDDTITHLIPVSIPVGERVSGEIDWDHRFSLMQNHTGEHIVSGLIKRSFDFENVGFHMGDMLTIDLSGEFSFEEALEIERKANEAVWKNLPVETVFPEPGELETIDYRSKKELSGKVRLISIENTDLCACCGLHVAKTGEIGIIKLLSLIRYKGGVRIEMVCGEKALKDYERKHADVIHIKNLLSVKPEEVKEAVERILKESGEKDEKISRINRRYWELKTERLEAENGLIIDIEEDMNNIELRKFCDALNKSGKAEVSLVLSPSPENPGVFRYVMASASSDLKAAVPVLNKELNGKGGGSKEMIQGTFAAQAEKIKAVVKDWKKAFEL